MNLPNALTVLRLFLTGAFIWAMLSDGMASMLLAAFIFILASITDFLDGYFARRDGTHTNFGKIMDPIADKFLVLSAFYIFSYLGIFPSWLFFLIAAREIFVTLIRFYAMSQGRVLAAERMGKAKTVSQIASIIIILIFLVMIESPLTASWPSSVFSAYGFCVVVFMYFVTGITLLSGAAFLKNNWGFKRVR